MQVFIIGSPLETAMCLDKKRLNKQIIECQQILKAIWGESKAWANHPCTIQYREHETWLWYYYQTLAFYRDYLNNVSNQFGKLSIDDLNEAKIKSLIADSYMPNFHTEEYFKNMKKRLYTKDNEHYKQWKILGESYENWYWVDNKWKIYKQTK
jgi:hypothetical protein